MIKNNVRTWYLDAHLLNIGTLGILMTVILIALFIHMKVKVIVKSNYQKLVYSTKCLLTVLERIFTWRFYVRSLVIFMFECTLIKTVVFCLLSPGSIDMKAIPHHNIYILSMTIWCYHVGAPMSIG